MAEDSYPLGTFPLLPPPYAPLLNTVSADLPPNSNWDWIRAACKASPCLSRLTTSQFSIDWFSVTNLTQVHFIDPVSMFEVLQVMEQATGLEDGSFDVIGPNATCSTGKTLVMSKMWRLEVTSPDHLGEFLDQLELPCLADISMHQIANWPEEQFNSFLSRSSCALQKLEFHEVDIFEDQLIECLRKKACNTLEHLIGVNIIPPASRLIQHLTYRSSPYPNPRLETIVLGNVEAEDGLFAALLESRVVKTTRDANGPPCAVRTAGFSFIEGAHHSRETTHLEDWRRLRILERMCPDLTLIWPNPDDEED
ncbi:hypothetical protein C8R43DRAFT_988052 [Mycena crocata]|nr:hypothetical protein C8R43DRAFT_988052 [Mycena crocata]